MRSLFLSRLLRAQPRSQGTLSTSRKYFLEAERVPWERGWSEPFVSDTSRKSIDREGLRESYGAPLVQYTRAYNIILETYPFFPIGDHFLTFSATFYGAPDRTSSKKVLNGKRQLIRRLITRPKRLSSL